MSDLELGRHHAAVSAELVRLGGLLERDARMAAGARPPPMAVGKLTQRLVRTRSRWNHCRARQAAAESEIRRRQGAELALTELERHTGY